MTVPRNPELIVHTFLPVDSPTASTKLWNQIIASGLDQPIRHYPRHPEDSTATGIVAATHKALPGQVHEAVAYRTPEIMVVSVRRADNDHTVDWGALRRRWDNEMSGPPVQAIGTAMVFLGQWPRPRWRQFWSPMPPMEIAQSGLPRGDQLGSSYQTEEGFLLWELLAADAKHRRLVVLGPARTEEAMDGWAWFAGGPMLPPLTRYLMHAAAVRHQAEVLNRALPRLRDARERVDRRCVVLTDLLRSPEPSVSALAAGDQALGVVLTEQSGLLTAETDAANMAQTVTMARRAMTTALALGPVPPAGGPPAEDHEIATWLEEQLATELTYLRSAQRKAAELSRLASAVVEQRRHRRGEKLTLLQASVVGALLMALAATQAFVYKVPIHASGPVLGPSILLLTTVALLVPAAVLYWPDRAEPDLPTARFQAAYLVGAAIFGMELGWLGTSVGWVLGTNGAAPPRWSLVIAALAAVLTALVASILLRRWRQR